MDATDGRFACSECGTETTADAKRCARCGAPFDIADEAVTVERIELPPNSVEAAFIRSVLDDRGIEYSVVEGQGIPGIGPTVTEPSILFVRRDQAAQVRELLASCAGTAGVDAPAGESDGDEQLDGTIASDIIPVESEPDDTAAEEPAQVVPEPPRIAVRHAQAAPPGALLDRYAREAAAGAGVEGIAKREVGGFLLAFCIDLTLLRPAGLLVLVISFVSTWPESGFRDLSRLWSHWEEDLLVILAISLSVLYGFIVGLRLWRVAPGAVASATAYCNFLLFYAGAFMIALFILSAASGVEPGPRVGLHLLEVAINAVVIKFYLKNSSRVKATYPEG